MASIAIIDQHETLFPVLPNVIVFARETNSLHGHVANSLKVNNLKKDKNQL